MCLSWWLHVLAIAEKSMESSQVLLGTWSGQNDRSSQWVAGSPEQPPLGLLGQNKDLALDRVKWGREGC
jgi:hypothetical protein